MPNRRWYPAASGQWPRAIAFSTIQRAVGDRSAIRRADVRASSASRSSGSCSTRIRPVGVVQHDRYAVTARVDRYAAVRHRLHLDVDHQSGAAGLVGDPAEHLQPLLAHGRLQHPAVGEHPVPVEIREQGVEHRALRARHDMDAGVEVGPLVDGTGGERAAEAECPRVGRVFGELPEPRRRLAEPLRQLALGRHAGHPPTQGAGAAPWNGPMASCPAD